MTSPLHHAALRRGPPRPGEDPRLLKQLAAPQSALMLVEQQAFELLASEAGAGEHRRRRFDEVGGEVEILVGAAVGGDAARQREDALQQRHGPGRRRDDGAGARAEAQTEHEVVPGGVGARVAARPRAGPLRRLVAPGIMMSHGLYGRIAPLLDEPASVADFAPMPAALLAIARPARRRAERGGRHAT